MVGGGYGLGDGLGRAPAMIWVWVRVGMGMVCGRKERRMEGRQEGRKQGREGGMQEGRKVWKKDTNESLPSENRNTRSLFSMPYHTISSSTVGGLQLQEND